jgi:hypothetical protein
MIFIKKIIFKHMLFEERYMVPSLLTFYDGLIIAKDEKLK